MLIAAWLVWSSSFVLVVLLCRRGSKKSKLSLFGAKSPASNPNSPAKPQKTSASGNTSKDRNSGGTKTDKSNVFDDVFKNLKINLPEEDHKSYYTMDDEENPLAKIRPSRCHPVQQTAQATQNATAKAGDGSTQRTEGRPAKLAEKQKQKLQETYLHQEAKEAKLLTMKTVDDYGAEVSAPSANEKQRGEKVGTERTQSAENEKPNSKRHKNAPSAAVDNFPEAKAKLVPREKSKPIVEPPLKVEKTQSEGVKNKPEKVKPGTGGSLSPNVDPVRKSKKDVKLKVKPMMSSGNVSVQCLVMSSKSTKDRQKKKKGDSWKAKARKKPSKDVSTKASVAMPVLGSAYYAPFPR